MQCDDLNPPQWPPFNIKLRDRMWSAFYFLSWATISRSCDWPYHGPCLETASVYPEVILGTPSGRIGRHVTFWIQLVRGSNLIFLPFLSTFITWYFIECYECIHFMHTCLLAGGIGAAALAMWFLPESNLLIDEFFLSAFKEIRDHVNIKVCLNTKILVLWL